MAIQLGAARGPWPRVTRVLVLSLLPLLLALAGCSSGHATESAGGSGSGSGGGGGGNAGSGGHPVTGVDCPSDIGFPAAGSLRNVSATVTGQTVRIRFDPEAKAADYRVYALPNKADVSGDTNKNATYRCAGDYEIPSPAVEDDNSQPSPAVHTRINSPVAGYARTTADATLGYVATAPGPARVPVYALGDPATDADNVICYYMRWPESRVKRYTTSDAERTMLLSQRWRDDGIAFYATKTGGAGTITVYEGTDDAGGPLYVTPGPEHDQRVAKGKTFTEAFSIDAAPGPDTEPLMRVHYDQTCARGHDELAAGTARFNKAYKQGNQPIAELHFSGLTESTTLVVEAVDALCPFQGILSPRSRPARVDPFPQPAGDISYPAFLTPDEVRAASKTGEVYVGGQGDAATTPHAIARACVTVAPTAPPAMDFRYDGSPEAYSAETSITFQSWQLASPTFDVELLSTATDEWALGSLFGELWTPHADWAGDTNGKLRFTPKTSATLSADMFLHATMEVDTVSSDRRYPQMLISDQPIPVQENLPNGGTVVVQTRGGLSGPTLAEIQLCDHRTWDVNNQCPRWDLYSLNGNAFLSPQLEMNGIGGVDRTVLFDVYVSTSRVYLLTNGTPYGCVDLPPGKIAAGTATVTFGDVLYHSLVDFQPSVAVPSWYTFHIAKMQDVTSRHFSNLAFKSNVPAPSWDEDRVPCVAASELQ